MTDDALRANLDIVIRRWRVVAAMVVLAALAAGVVSMSLKPTFEATATVALAPATLSVPTSTQSPPYYLIVDSPRRLPTAYTPTYYVTLVKSGELVDPAVRQVDVSVSTNGSDRSLIEITARSDNPRLAAQAANAWAQAGVEGIQRQLVPQGGEVNAAYKQLDAAERALVKFSQDNALGDYDLSRLRSISALPSEKKLELAHLLRVRDTAETIYMEFAADLERSSILASTVFRPMTILSAREPSTPTWPKPVQNVLIGAVLGLLIGVLSAFAADYVSVRKIKAEPVDSS